MFQKLLKFAAWAGLCVIAYSTLSPLGDRPILLTSSKLEHVAAFAVLGTLFCLAYPRRTLAVLLIVLGSAALLELLAASHSGSPRANLGRTPKNCRRRRTRFRRPRNPAFRSSTLLVVARLRPPPTP